MILLDESVLHIREDWVEVGSCMLEVRLVLVARYEHSELHFGAVTRLQFNNNQFLVSMFGL